ncbi:ABC transporter permease subunit [Roseiflexus sp.]|uniref:ABC transporter permease subunit n=1 Tax=Roseiflexus sp. TaxID=2562120 RepID=UPI00398B2E0B
MGQIPTLVRKNLVLLLTLAVILALFIAAASGMSRQDFVITLLRGLAVGMLTFLVASGFSLIFGLLDVLNLAHGTLFMIGAYIGWTMYVRPDTVVDVLTPLALIVSGFTLRDVWVMIARRIPSSGVWKRLAPWMAIIPGALIGFGVLRTCPIAFWSLENYAESPVTFSFLAGQGQRVIPAPAAFDDASPLITFGGLILASMLVAFGLTLLGRSDTHAESQLTWRSFGPFASLIAAGLIVFAVNDPLTAWLFALDTGWLFLIAVLTAALSGMGLGALMEATLIRPLYVRPIYQLMLTLGLSAIGIEMVRAIWGRPEFTMPKPALFAGSGEGCPAESLWLALQNGCATMVFQGGRIRVYNEIVVPLVGLVVLIAVWLLLKRTRLGMIIRAGVQDRQMVEALGINVRRVFTMVFALGVGLAALGGVLAAPAIGLSNTMGESFLLNALIALAIGGLTSYPGAAIGSLLVGMLQQFIIKYGQIGIAIPFTEIVFKPSPPLVPASTLLLMVIILLILPNGLLGRKE